MTPKKIKNLEGKDMGKRKTEKIVNDDYNKRKKNPESSEIN